MKLQRILVLAAAIALMLAAVACAGGQSATTPDTDATGEARVKQEAAAQPTATPVDVVKEVSSTTPEPIPTSIPIPTNTPLPKPTDAPEPTFTPAPSPLEVMWNQRVEEAFTPYDCPPATKPELGNSDYKGPLIDTHFHMSHLWDASLEADADGRSYERDVLRGEFPLDEPILGKNHTMAEIACRLEREGTDRVHAFFFVESERPGQLRPYLEVARRTMELYPTRFVPFIQALCCNETVPTVDARTLSEYLEIYPGLFQGIGEIVLWSFALTHRSPIAWKWSYIE